MNRTCETCEHATFGDDRDYSGLCYRYPEEISTSRTHHCGEWKAKEDNILREYGKK